MKTKLTLKTDNMGISITIWGLWVSIETKQGVKLPKMESFLYFSSRNINKLTCKDE